MKNILSLGITLFRQNQPIVVQQLRLRSKIIMGCSTSKAKIKQTKKEECLEDAGAFIEGVVCKDSDIQENEIKSFDLQDAGKVLLVRQNGKLSALGTKCTHYGAPLVGGALGDGRIRCPWHGACFNITTGDIEDFPGLDSLPCYTVTVENGEVKVRAKKAHLETNKRVKTMTGPDCAQDQRIVVIGGGPSGATCIETLRQEGFRGHITLVAKENYLPYDRVKVSKNMDFEIAKAQYRTDEFYEENGIVVLKNTEAVGVETENNIVKLGDGKTLNYDRLYIATGSKAARAKIPGADLKNVLVLRDYDHASYTNSQLGPDKHVVILGSSFIGMEAATFCVNKVEKVTVVGRDSAPFKASLGPEVGAAIMKYFEKNGVNFCMNSGLKCCVDNGSGAVGSVELTDGTILKADICIMGVGGSFCTEFLENSGIARNPNGSVDVDEYLQTNVANVFAGGDIANAPVWSHEGRKATIGHYGLAQFHGRIAALNMVDKKTPLKAVPYFWTMLFGKSFRYAGHGAFDSILYSGNVDELKFVALYLKDGKVVSISSCQMDPVVSTFAERLAQGKELYKKDLGDDVLAWSK